jgi:hypothetical protein
VVIASEGLPLHYDKLRDLFLEYNVGFGVDEDEVKRDLPSYRSYLNSEKINRLQLEITIGTLIEIFKPTDTI